jgi:hypothetical protein
MKAGSNPYKEEKPDNIGQTLPQEFVSARRENLRLNLRLLEIEVNMAVGWS